MSNDDLRDVMALAKAVFPATAHIWLFYPSKDLGNQIPWNLIRNGEAERVKGLLRAIGEGVTS